MRRIAVCCCWIVVSVGASVGDGHVQGGAGGVKVSGADAAVVATDVV